MGTPCLLVKKGYSRVLGKGYFLTPFFLNKKSILSILVTSTTIPMSARWTSAQGKGSRDETRSSQMEENKSN